MDLTITTSLPPNLLAHIYVLAGIIKNPEYKEKNNQTLRKSRLDFLHSLKPYMVGKPPMGGVLYLYLYQYPSYFPTENIDELLGTFNILLNQNNPKTFSLHDTSGRTEKGYIETWMPSKLFKASPEFNQSILKKLHRIIPELKTVINEAHEDFYIDHWNEIKPKLQHKANDIQECFNDVNVFEAWREALRLNFPYREFVVYVVESLRGGTSIIAEKFAMPYDVSLVRAVDTIIHEVGVHHIINIKEYLRRGLSPASFLQNTERIGRMEEAATCYFKPAVYKRLGLELREDYHVPMMRIEDEIKRFKQLWETEEPIDAIDAILGACELG